MKQELSRLETETSESRVKVRTLEAKIREAEARKARLRSRLGALQLAENQWQKVVAEEMEGYFRRRMEQTGYYGARELWEESFRRAAILEKTRYVDELYGFERKTQAAQVEAIQEKRQLEVKSEKVLAEHKSREGLYRQKQEVYRETQQKVMEALKAVQELQNSALALAHLIQALERQSPYKPSGVKAPLAESRHSLPWPAEGRVVSAFGKQMVSELRTWVVHQGIRLATAKAAPVRPVKSGKVIFVGPFRSYGQVVIVDHGQSLYSIYGMLGEVLKKRGDQVQTSAILGTAGPSPEGGTVYFEIRHSGEALDPLVWLEKRS